MITLASMLERTKSAVGVLLAGMFLLRATGALPRVNAESHGWRHPHVALAVPATGLRSTESAARSPRSFGPIEIVAPSRAVSLAIIAAWPARATTQARSGAAISVAGRGYDATAPPTLS